MVSDQIGSPVSVRERLATRIGRRYWTVRAGEIGRLGRLGRMGRMGDRVTGWAGWAIG
jgi:hypothetical protein